jgi:cbb3-type cytochrome oxidase subunit 3
VWIQDYDFVDKCTVFIYSKVEFDECTKRNAFICEIDPKIIINPLSWQADIVAISVISLFFVGIFFICCIGYFWFAKSKRRHTQRLERRNSIRQSIRSLNMIDPQGSMRRRGYVS